MYIDKMVSKVSITPAQFTDLVGLVLDFDYDGLRETGAFLDKLCEEFDERVEEIGDTYSAMVAEAKNSLRTKNPFDMNQQEDWFQQFKHTMGAGNFVALILSISRAIQNGFHALRDTVHAIQPMNLMLFGDVKPPTTREELQAFVLLVQMNQEPLQRFVEGVENAAVLQNLVVSIARGVVFHLEMYHKMLRHRHSVEGIKIHGDPVRTDLAISIYENADAHGEIQDGKKPDEISVYTQRKATILADALCGGLFGGFVKEPGEIIDFLSENLTSMWEGAEKIEAKIHTAAEKIRRVTGGKPPRRLMNESEFKEALRSVSELDPRNVRERDKVGLKSPEEQMEIDFRNETISTISGLLLTEKSGQEIVKFVLARKAQWYKIHRDENSFYVCKVGAGNSFLGEAPGALEVIPGLKPKVSLGDLVGSGFDEVREMVEQAKDSSMYADLFRATSPSGKTDKSNVLLVGPMGCGKTEALRAISSERNALTIFAQGSDFLTCWKGEAEKNPKRLFEAALQLHKETERQAFISIDEIDTVLNGNQGHEAFGGTNLTTEFQILMDGVLSYSGISVWGATNHPERMSMPIIRRFAKVLLVGELAHVDRVKLLRRSLSYLPLSPNFSDVAWTDASTKLEGAVGDTVRKMADDLWRKNMRNFVNRRPEKAQEVVKFLQEEGTKFDRSKFSLERQAKLERMLRENGIEITPDDLINTIDRNLESAAIRAEIQTAKNTYRVARQHLVGLVGPGNFAEAAE